MSNVLDTSAFPSKLFPSLCPVDSPQSLGEDEDIPYIFDDISQPEASESLPPCPISITTSTPQTHEYKANFFSMIQQTSQYIESMIENLFLEKQKKYAEEFLTEKNLNLLLPKPKPVSSSQTNSDGIYSQENRENVDPLAYLVPKNVAPKNETKAPTERKVLLEENKTKEESKDEENGKKDKSSLLARIQNSLKDLTSNVTDKAYHLENLEPTKEETNLKTNLTELKARIAHNSSGNTKAGVRSVFLQSKRAKSGSLDIRNFLVVSKNSIKYGSVLPGYIMEDDLEIQNKSTQSISFKINVVCHNSELDDHDEYVYSIRKLSIYDYNEKIVSVLPPHNSLKYKIALKVPNLKAPCELKGSVIITVQGLESNITIPISSHVEIPEIYCPKEIFDQQNSCSLIKFALKKGKKQDCKIPFKNNSGVNVCMEFEFIEPQGKKYGYDLITYPNTVNLAANGLGILNLILKPSVGAGQSAEQQSTDNEIRRVLLAKIKNSTMIYYFPLSIEIY